MRNNQLQTSPVKLLKRIFSYALKYRLRLIVVFFSIVISAATNAIGISFTKQLIDRFIEPLSKQENPDFGPLLKIITLMGIMYFTGAMFTYVYNRTMVTVSQGIFKDIRDEMFTHMEKLPVRYYDSHPTGDI